MKFEVSFKRVEYIRFQLFAKSKKAVKEIIENANWCLDDEKVDEIENKCFKIDEIK